MAAEPPEAAKEEPSQVVPVSGEPVTDAAAVPAEEAAPLAPIIVKKIIDEGHAGAHGGAWKIALADMMTAMMAFFLLMWLLGATNADQSKDFIKLLPNYWFPVLLIG